MTPPGGTNGKGNGSSPSAQIITLFPSKDNPKLTTVPVNDPTPDSSRHSDHSLPSVSEYLDFSNLRALTEGLGPVSSKGPFARIFTLVSLMTNPKVNGSIDATLIRNGNHFHITQENPQKEIHIRYSQETSSRGNDTKILKPIYELIYYPDGSVKNIPSFDTEGKPASETVYELGKLRRAGEMNHLRTVTFLEKRVEILGKGLNAFTRLATPLLELKPTRRDLGQRANWYENYIVIDGDIFSLRTQNLGSAAFETSPSQNQITVHKHSNGKYVEVVKISKTGEVSYNPSIGARKPPSVAQFDIINKIITEIEFAHSEPQAYQEKLTKNIRAMGVDFSATIEIPKIGHTAIKLSALPDTQGEFNEKILKIEKGRDLLRRISPIWGQSERWVNPTNPAEVRYLRPKGSIRWSMFKEYARWFGNALWHGVVNDVTKIKPNVGHLNLHMFPDGTAELKIHRDTKRVLKNGETHWENGLYNVVRRTADGKTIDLGQIVKKLAAKDPVFANLPRDKQLIEADRSQFGNSYLTDNPLLQEVPELPIRQLEIESPSGSKREVSKGPTSSLAALEAIENLPQVREAGLRTRRSAMVKGSILGQTTGFAPENFFELHFPGANPATHITISEDTLKTEGNKKRVVIHMWHGDTVVTGVYDNGTLNQHESARLNMSEVHRARQGHYRPWFPGWAFLKGTSFVRISHYCLHGGAFVFGNYASFPIAQGYEKLFWTDAEQKAIGTPSPDFSSKALWKEVKSAGILMTASGAGLVTTEGLFNWGGALRNIYKEMHQSNVTFGQAWRHNSPRWHNEPPVRFRPIHKQGAILRNFFSRGVPLITGLFALEMVHHGWEPSSIFGLSLENYSQSFSKVNWQQFNKSLLRVGAVSLVSSGVWSWSAHRAELAMVKRMPGQPIRGLGGLLLRNRFLTTASRQVGGARLAMTYRASLVTILLEMAALRIWDSYDRKENLLAQEIQFRDDLSQAIDRRNETMSRLENGEAMSPRKIFEAQSEVQGAFQRYRSYLQILDRNEGPQETKAIPTKNRFSEAYDSYRLDYNALSGGNLTSSAHLLAQSKMRLTQRLQSLREQETRREENLQKVFQKYGLSSDLAYSEESLSAFLGRTLSIADENPAVIDKLMAETTSEPSSHSPQLPVSLDSDAGKALIEHLNWKISEDPAFLSWEKSRQAEYILSEFSGYRTQGTDGSTRPWNMGETIAFLDAIDAENTQRINRLEPPLTSITGNPDGDQEKYQQLAIEVENIVRQENSVNAHQENIKGRLARNIPELDRQMESYEKNIGQRIDEAILQYIPKNLEDFSQKSAAKAQYPISSPRSLVIGT